MRLFIDHGDAIAAAAGAVALLLSMGFGRWTSPGTWVRSFALGGVVAFGAKNLAELNSIIADTLLPK